jgi:uncharacterized OB-fold protein
MAIFQLVCPHCGSPNELEEDELEDPGTWESCGESLKETKEEDE